MNDENFTQNENKNSFKNCKQHSGTLFKYTLFTLLRRNDEWVRQNMMRNLRQSGSTLRWFNFIKKKKIFFCIKFLLRDIRMVVYFQWNWWLEKVIKNLFRTEVCLEKWNNEKCFFFRNPPLVPPLLTLILILLMLWIFHIFAHFVRWRFIPSRV
jgi:hypothetical protein